MAAMEQSLYTVNMLNIKRAELDNGMGNARVTEIIMHCQQLK